MKRRARRSASPPASAEYVPRRPAATVLYGIVRDHLETFLDHTRTHYDKPLPRYVEAELRGYLECGDYGRGFLRLHCDACRQDVLVPFSCKGRGLCPSCGARRMCNEAAAAVDRVLPNVPIRQWVPSLPFELRRLAAFDAKVLTTLGRLFVVAIFAEQRSAAGLKGAACGAMTHVQRFGGSLNLNCHYLKTPPLPASKALRHSS
jgi:hypothetical protein